MNVPDTPHAWRRFALQLAVLLAAIASLLLWRGGISGGGWGVAVGIAAAIALAGWLRPAWIRPLHRAGLAASLWLGHHLGGLLLALLFFTFIVPMGWILRLRGYDPLGLHRRAGAQGGYWRPARAPGRMDRMY